MRDSGDPSFSDTAEVTIEIKDYNDNPPVFSPVGYGTKVREDIDPGSYLMSVTARDSDTGTNKDFKYSIFEGNPDKQFRIDPKHGHVYVNQRLDRETQESYLLTIRATNIGRNCVKIGAKSFLVHKRFWGQNEVILLSLVCAFECKNVFIEQNIKITSVMPPAFSRETQSNRSFVACEGFKFTISCCEESYFICFAAELVFLSQTEAAEDRFGTASEQLHFVPNMSPGKTVSFSPCFCYKKRNYSRLSKR